MLPEEFSGFTAALLAPDAPVPANLVDPEGRIAPKRFAVYRNNVTVSLIAALKAVFPAVLALVGEEFFEETARRFVRQSPPQSPLLFDYGRDFPAFLAAFPAASGLPFLGDVARLDRAWLDAYHAADRRPLDPATLNGLAEDRLMDLRFTSLPATRLIRSEFPLVTIWRAARAGRQPQFDVAPQPEWGLVTRPDVTVEVAALAPAGGRFFEALMGGDSLGGAAETAFAVDSGFDLAAALGQVVGGGVFSGVTAPHVEETR